jgi:hypothetical protein
MRQFAKQHTLRIDQNRSDAESKVGGIDKAEAGLGAKKRSTGDKVLMGLWNEVRRGSSQFDCNFVDLDL